MAKRKIELPDLPRRPPARTGAAPIFGIESSDGAYRTVAIAQLHGDPQQPRKHFDIDALERLAASIRERGLLQPPVVRPGPEDQFIIIAGERRVRAASIAGLQQISVLVHEADETDSLALALMENVVREDLSPVEEARAISTLLRDLHVTQQTLGRRLGMSQSEVANTMRMLDLPEDVLDLVDAGALSKSHGRALLAEPDERRRRALAGRAVEQGWSVRQLNDQIAAGSRGPASKLAAPQRQYAALLQDRVSSAAGVELDVVPYRSGFAFRVKDAQAARALAVALGVAPDTLSEP